MTRKPIIYTADAIRVDGDEGRYGLIIDTDEGDKVYVDIHAVVLDFYASVRAEIRPYVIESDHARATMPVDSDDRDYTDLERDTGILGIGDSDLARATMVQYGADEEHDMTQAYHEHGDLFRDIARGK